jgi:hypothetical protein
MTTTDVSRADLITLKGQVDRLQQATATSSDLRTLQSQVDRLELSIRRLEESEERRQKQRWRRQELTIWGLCGLVLLTSWTMVVLAIAEKRG